MELKIKSLLKYMDKAKDELNNLREERKKLSKEKESFSNKETSFYKDVELSYNKKSEEYDAYVKLVSDKVKSKKKEILEGYSEKMGKLNGTNNKLNEELDYKEDVIIMDTPVLIAIIKYHVGDCINPDPV